MSQTKKTYTLGKIKQLIDLNGDSTNFDLSFKVTCKNDTPFDLLVVDQTTLDNTPELQYKQVNRTISGNIVSDKNIYQNFFLILKSDKKCDVDVELTKKVLPKTPDVSTEINTPSIHTANGHTANGHTANGHTANHRQLQEPEDSINWKKIGLIALVVILGICVLVWLYKRKGSDTGQIASDSGDFDHTANYHTANGVFDSNCHTPLNNPKFIPNLSAYSHKSASSPLSQTSIHSFASSKGSNKSYGSSESDNGNSLLSRLKKFAQ